jgi:acyl-CoA synthetase (AMP-forming)/AMP-acid ligase II
MDGYWRQSEATRTAMAGGWFHTGDIATVDDSNYLRIVDRKKDIIISGGENISSLEVENILLAHPAVYEAVVIPVPDQKWGEAPKALVVLKLGAQTSAAGTDPILPLAASALQVSTLDRVPGKPAQNRHRQTSETRVATAILDYPENRGFVAAVSKLILPSGSRGAIYGHDHRTA